MASNEQLPIDPNVVVPKHVLEAAQRAEQVHHAAYDNPPTETASPETVPAESSPQAAAPVAAAEPKPETIIQNTPPAEAPATENWEHRYNSMKGRWQASERQMGEMRAQMDMMAVEIQRSQELLQTRTPDVRREGTTNSDIPHENLITPEDRETYGDDLLNVARKVAVQTLKPEIDNLRAQNDQLRQQVISTAQRDLKARLTQAVPNWPAIAQSEAFKNWLRLPNVYTGQVRKVMLEAAFKAADAPKVVALYKEFVQEVVATGGVVPGSRTEQPTQVAPAPHQPAIDPMTIVAPGKARPAGGDTPSTPADKPIYTRAWIAQFYRDINRGIYNGREAEKSRIESDLSRAQFEGRIR